MKKNINQAILITGSSSGIGYSSVVLLAGQGFKIFAGVRTTEDAQKLSAIGDNVFPVILDITKQETIESAYTFISKSLNDEQFSLINNAGIAVASPIETIDIDKFQTQFEVNVFSQIRLIQKFMPIIRDTKGKIINISSIFGTLHLPYAAPYCASKAALDALSTGLRLELKRWNVPVVIIKPGVVKTPIWQKSLENAQKDFTILDSISCCHYEEEFISLTSLTAKLSKYGADPNKVASLISKVLYSKNPKFIYIIGIDSIIINFIRKFPQVFIDKGLSLLVNKGLQICKK